MKLRYSVLTFALVAALALSFAACGTPTEPDPIPSPSPSPSPEPVPSPTPAPTVYALLTVDVYNQASRQLVFWLDHGVEGVLRANLFCTNPETREKQPCPFVEEYAWQDFSDPAVRCMLFGPLTSDHPHVQCAGDGMFIFRVTAVGYGGETIGKSSIYSLPIGQAGGSSNGFRELSADEARRYE
jgi:hypothetical protein